MPKIIPELILASQSPSRKLLLEQLKIPFTILPADIDESPLPKENPKELVERLSKCKAHAVIDKITANSTPNDKIIISSDQVAVCENNIYGKPGNFDNAYDQLKFFSDKTIEFITGLCITSLTVKNKKTVRQEYYYKEISKIKLKKLSDQQIINYLKKEQPYQCAASFKIEGLGIALVESIETADFHAIIGLPLIKLVDFFEKLGYFLV